MTPELSRVLPLDRVGAADLPFEVEATEAERAAVAARLKIPAVLALSCRWRLRRDPSDAAVLMAAGQLSATVVQTCVVTLEPFESPVAESFRLRFIPADRDPADEDPESDDEIAYDAATLDLGEVTVEQLALNLDPFPRAPGAALATLEEDAPASPFAALAARRRP